ncbi:Casein kinase I isoform epsilon [Tritrichomonas foetus]|uniref:non-specific serine/threonine protein kinase n=1 Tax=Tritrichomonas foetus TaxID=1144522 RepID=A0A1J4K8W2_9EUKA|nr:Casein kinase I isoform epsilon [Tritrichomonas foetus]|eukprot:OHT06156.1 Casein kinase I isoform epsilon [Tritrichomonas foetus]
MLFRKKIIELQKKIYIVTKSFDNLKKKFVKTQLKKVLINFFKHVVRSSEKQCSQFIQMNSIKLMYQTKRLLGSGGFGKVYSGENPTTKEEVALKISSHSLSTEFSILRHFQGAVGFPQVFDYFTADGTDTMVMERLDNSVQYYLKQSKTLSLKTVLQIADQVLMRIEYCHNKGYIHRDIKPSNILVGTHSNSNLFYLIDFGLAYHFFKAPKSFLTYGDDDGAIHRAGTSRFSSINSMNGSKPSPADDLESLGYVLVYLLKGKLPWQGIKSKCTERKNDAILTQKMITTTKMLCEDLPEEFEWYLKQVKSLSASDRPKYSEYRKKFRDLFIRMNFNYDSKFEWNSISGIKFNFVKKSETSSEVQMAPAVRPSRSGDHNFIRLSSFYRLTKSRESLNLSHKSSIPKPFHPTKF